MSKSIGLNKTNEEYPKDASCLDCHWKLMGDGSWRYCPNGECKSFGKLTVAYCFDSQEIEPEIL